MTKSRFQKALIASVVLHVLFALVIWSEPSFLIHKPRQFVKTDIELVDANELLKKFQKASEDGQIVSQSEQRINDEVDEKTKYLSKHNQRVEKQTRAELNDAFRNTTNAGGAPSPQQKPGEAQVSKEQTLSQNDKKTADAKTVETNEAEAADKSTAQAKEVLTDVNGVASAGSMKNFMPSFRPKPIPMGTQAAGGGDGPSATDDRLKNVPTGLQTMLSTREFVYYSYYNRIKDKLRQYWEPKIKEKMERVMRQGRNIASVDAERITKCVIVLDARGTLVRVQVIGQSGIVDLDQAAVEAFQAAAPFPNPPKGIVEKDGYIRIRWDFILEANTRSLHYQNYALNK